MPRPKDLANILEKSVYNNDPQARQAKLYKLKSI
jgi:hypothetical protein